MLARLLFSCGAVSIALAFVPITVEAQVQCLTPESRIEVNRRFVRIEGAKNLSDVLTRTLSARQLGLNVLRPEDTPLFVVDGVLLAAGTRWLDAIPLTDVEAVTTLRPVDATTRFGSAGSGGAIILETRQGRVAQSQPKRPACVERREP